MESAGVKDKLRKSGIGILGDVPWGTHFCQFYNTKKDLAEILVPYFKAGLENNEFCMWVTAHPLSEKEAGEALRKAVPDLDSRIGRGQIEIIPHSEWYLKGGSFDSGRVLGGWVDKLNKALEKGYDGLRLTGNTFWLEKEGWKDFVAYEKEVDSVIGGYRMIAICTYSLERCRASEVIDVVANHQFALTKRDGKWELIESSERRRAEEALRASEGRVREKLDSILSPEGDMGSLDLADIIDAPALQSLMDNFYELSHVPVGIIDLKGGVLVGVGWQDICTRFHRVHPETCKHCIESDTRLSAGVPPGEFKLYKCKNNMWDIATPIMVGNHHVGNIFLGQFFFEGEPLDYELFRSQARRYGFDEEKYIAALEAVPRMSRETVDAGMAFYMKLAHMLSQLSYGNIKLARSLAQRDALMDSLREGREDLDHAQAVAQVGSWRLNVHKNKLLWSDETYRIFEIPTGTPLTYEVFLAAVHPDDRDFVDGSWRVALRGEPYDIEHRIVVGDDVRWVRERAELEFDKEGALQGGFGTVQDITGRKRAEAELERALDEARRSQAEVSAMLEGARAVLRSHDFRDSARNIFTSCKHLLGAKAGYVALLSQDGSENEVVYLDSGGLPCTVDPSLPMPVRGLRAEAYRAGEPVYENRFGQSKWKEFMPAGHAGLENVMFAPLTIKGKTVGLLGLGNKPGGFTEDDARVAAAFGDLAAIALQKSRATESLEISELRFRSVAQTASDAIITIDKDCRVVLWNQSAEKIFGYPAGEALGMHISAIMPERFREDHDAGVCRLATTGKRNIVGKTVELTGLRKDGAEFPLELSLATWKTKEGVFFTGIIRDITERKRLEQEKADVYAMVTHDIKSPLTTIIGYSELITTTKKENVGADTLKMVESILRSGEKLNRMVEDFLMQSRLESGAAVFDLQPADPAWLLAEVREEFEEIARRKGLELVSGAPVGLPDIPLDRKYVMRALHNLVLNAVNYTPRGGRITLDARRRASDNGDFIEISVSDTGPGIPREDIAKVFEKYYRPARTSGTKGTGLGLAIVKAVAEVHGGRVELESRVGEGSTFRLILPVA